ncbi:MULTISPECIES: hypothetical protein [Nonomuraea]|uniref:Uncharacterized protein n=1 Tax=Nonomuraea mangrovi TaxID=2316207 RepID=A0ABW4TDB8_9ACTN
MLMTLAVTASLVLTGAHTDTQSLSFRGATIKVPAAWKVKKSGFGSVHVITGPCSKKAVDCQGFWLHGPQSIKYASEGNPFRVDQPYHPSSGVMECTHDKRYYSSPLPEKPTVSGLRQVGSGHKAYHREWKITCHSQQTFKPTKVTYPQRIWYLPASKILIVDEWSTPGLGAALKRAVWR